MKKTIAALMALAGMAAATELTPLWSKNGITLSGNNNYAITLSDGTYITSDKDNGYTAVITLDWDIVANSPMFWLGTDGGSNYKNSTATFGYTGVHYHAGLFNNTNGSNGDSTDNASGVTSTLQDYISHVIKNDSRDTSLADKTLTYFLTSKEGTSTLYGLTNKNEVTKIATQSGMAQGKVTGLHVGHWNTTANYHSGTLDIAIYNGVMEQSTMQKIAGDVIPEPTTATLSLLALAGLAARRRRK